MVHIHFDVDVNNLQRFHVIVLLLNLMFDQQLKQINNYHRMVLNEVQDYVRIIVYQLKMFHYDDELNQVDYHNLLLLDLHLFQLDVFLY